MNFNQNRNNNQNKNEQNSQNKNQNNNQNKNQQNSQNKVRTIADDYILKFSQAVSFDTAFSLWELIAIFFADDDNLDSVNMSLLSRYHIVTAYSCVTVTTVTELGIFFSQ